MPLAHGGGRQAAGGGTTTTSRPITVHTPTSGKTALHLSASDALIATLPVAVPSFFWLPIGGARSHRIGREPLRCGMTALPLPSACPAMRRLAAMPGFGHLLAVLLRFSRLCAMRNGAMVAALAEAMPAEVRMVGFSRACSRATAVSGGFTPIVSTWLLQAIADQAAPACWPSVAAACGLAAAFLPHRRRPDLRRGAPPHCPRRTFPHRSTWARIDGARACAGAGRRLRAARCRQRMSRRRLFPRRLREAAVYKTSAAL